MDENVYPASQERYLSSQLILTGLYPFLGHRFVPNSYAMDTDAKYTDIEHHYTHWENPGIKPGLNGCTLDHKCMSKENLGDRNHFPLKIYSYTNNDHNAIFSLFIQFY